jgi:hypothetical protein
MAKARSTRSLLAGAAALFILISQGVEPTRVVAQAQSVIDGTLEVYYEDGYDGGRLRHYLNTGTERVPLRFSQNPSRLAAGSRVRARGVVRDGTLMLDPAFGEAGLTTLALAPGSGTPSLGPVPLASPFTFGVQPTLVILFNFQDRATQPFTAAAAQSVTFSQVNNFFLENSYGQTSLSGIVAGWFTITSASTSCNYNTWASMADQAAINAGVDLSAYPRRVYGFPQTSACSWWGLGTVGGGSVPNPARAWVNGNFSLQVVAHEMGHGFGLYHSHSITCDSTACVTSEYGDDHDVMGWYAPNHFNAFQKERLGWLNYDASPSIESVTGSGTYSIEPYAAPNGGRPKALKILKSTIAGTNTYIYAEARTQYGADASLAPGVLIHTGVDIDGNQSFLEDVQPSSSITDFILAPGASFTFTDAVQPVTLTTVSFDGSGAVLNVALSCSYSLASSAQLFGPSAGTGNVGLSAGADCPWTAVSRDSWITLDPASTSGIGTSSIQFSVASNTSGLTRTGTLTIAGRTLRSRRRRRRR